MLNTTPSGRRSSHSGRLCVTALLSCVGVYVAGLLTVEKWYGLALYCGASSACEKAVASNWSSLFGVPIAAIGVFAYISIFITSISGISGFRMRAAISIGFYVSGVATSVSSALLTVSSVQLRSACLWCVLSGVLLAIIFYIHLGMWSTDNSLDMAKKPKLTVALLSCLLASGIAVIATCRVLERKSIDHDDLALSRMNALELTPATSHTIGDPRGRLTLIVFADFECQACHEAVPELLRAMHKSRGTRLVYRHMPLDQYPLSFSAAVASERLSSEVGFWKFVNSIYSQPSLSHNMLKEKMTEHHLPVQFNNGALRATRGDPAVTRVLQDLDVAHRLGLKVTPSIIVLENGHPRQVVNFRRALRMIELN